MMKVTYDKEIDAKYIYFKKGKVVETKPISDNVLYDIDKNGEIIGVEVLDSSKHDVTVFVDGGLISVCTEESGEPNGSVEFKKEYPTLKAKDFAFA